MMSLPTNTSAIGAHGPSSTILPSNSHSRASGHRAMWAMMVLSRLDLPEPGSPPIEQVAVHQGDGHREAVLVDPERDRVVDRIRRPPGTGEGVVGDDAGTVQT